MIHRPVGWKPRVKAIGYLMCVLFGISLATFFLAALAPGDPAEIILRDRYETPGQDQIDALRMELGLDDPWPIRYLVWMGRLVRLDLGQSWLTGQPVAAEIFGRLGATLELAAAAFGITLVISCAWGTLAALCKNKLPDMIFQGLAIFTTAMPAFWLGTLLVYLFSLKFPFFPVAGRDGPGHLVLPALTLALGLGFIQANVLRATLIEILSQDHVRFAKARGLSPWMIFYRHILPGALAPMVTLWGISLGQLMGGAVIVETLFAWPGVGRLLVQSVMARDIPCTQALVLFMALAFVLANRLADLIHCRLDPRLKGKQ